jgi:Ion channel
MYSPGAPQQALTPSRKEERASLLLFLSLLSYVLVGTFLEDDILAEGFLLLSLYGTLLAVTFYLSTKKKTPWLGALLALAVGVMTTIILFHRTRTIAIIFWTLLAFFFAFVISRLLTHMGRPGPVTTGRLYVAVSLYLLVGVFWFAIYNLLEAIYPGSFGQVVLGASSTRVPPRSFLYFSLETLTTLGYGDIVPITPKARSLSVLEAAAGILYIAVAVSRLAASYQAGYQIGHQGSPAPDSGERNRSDNAAS